MNKTKIEWCDSTWNPVTGCLHDCEYCYARKIATRFGGTQKYASIFEENEPVIDSSGKILPYPHSFSPTFLRYRFDEPQKQTKPRTIFVCSMADLFGEWVPDDWIEAVFEACKKAPQHRYLFLTKNPKRYAELDERAKLPISDNMWYGATAVNNEQFSEAIKSFGYLYAKTFLSIEPILENININNIHTPSGWCPEFKFYVDWIITGAESGNRKDKIIPEKAWIDNICNATDKANTPVFMKDSLIPIVGEKSMRREFPW